MKVAEVIKYEGDNQMVIWKHPSEDFNTNTQLIVHQSQEAIFYMNGQSMDLFPAGRYTLKTENIPIITKFLNKLTDDENPFHCEVYYVNKVEMMSIKWGVPDKIVFNENVNGNLIPFEIGARGEMSLRVENAKMLADKLVGTEPNLTKDQLVDKMFGLVTSTVKSNLVRTMEAQNMSIFTVDSHLDEISTGIKPVIEEKLAEYGVQLELFFIEAVKRPEDDPNYVKFKNYKAAVVNDVNEALLKQQLEDIKNAGQVRRDIEKSRGRAVQRQQEGYTYQQERGFDVASTAAANEAVGQFANVGIGMGVMSGLGGNIGSQVGAMTSDAMSSMNQGTQAGYMAGMYGAAGTTDAGMAAGMTAGVMGTVQNTAAQQAAGNFCPKCGGALPAGAAFCMHCGAKLARVCANCGAELPDGAAFCMKCGTKA